MTYLWLRSVYKKSVQIKHMTYLWLRSVYKKSVQIKQQKYCNGITYNYGSLKVSWWVLNGIFHNQNSLPFTSLFRSRNNWKCCDVVTLWCHKKLLWLLWLLSEHLHLDTSVSWPELFTMTVCVCNFYKNSLLQYRGVGSGALATPLFP